MGSGPSQPEPILRDRAALVALIAAGLTIDEIAARAGCSRSTVRRTARRLDLPPFKPGRRPTPMLDRDALAALLASDLTTAQIAGQLGRSTTVVRSWVRHHGLAFPHHSNRRPDPPQLLDPEWLRREHHDRQQSTNDIARAVGRSRQVVSRRFRQYGIPIRQQRTYPQLRDARWLEEQFAAGKSAAAIAAEVGCSKAAVRLAAIDAGVSPRARRP